MKNFIMVLVLFLLANINVNAQRGKEFELKGNIKGLKDGTMIYLTSMSWDTLAKAESRESTFTLKGHIPGEANFYFLSVDSVVKKREAKNRSDALWLANSEISLSGNLQDMRNLKLKGSEPQVVYRAFLDLKNKNKKKAEWDSIRRSFIQQNLNSLFIPWLLQAYGANMYQDIYLKLSSKSKNSFYGMISRNQIELSTSGIIPDFHVTTEDGTKTSIHKLAAKSKYTLIDFWASWCKPCREAIPKMKSTYEAFYSKGFNIVGVSRDRNLISWRKAIKEDGTRWIHVVDNIQDAGKVIFGLEAIPGYILIDRDGKIIRADYFSKTTKGIEGKTLFDNLYEIVEALFKSEKSK